MTAPRNKSHTPFQSHAAIFFETLLASMPNSFPKAEPYAPRGARGPQPTGSHLFFENRTASRFRNGARSTTSDLRAPSGPRLSHAQDETNPFQTAAGSSAAGHPGNPNPLSMREQIHLRNCPGRAAHEVTPSFGRTKPLHRNRQSTRNERTNPLPDWLSPAGPSANPAILREQTHREHRAAHRPQELWPNKPTTKTTNPRTPSEQTRRRPAPPILQF